MKRKHFLRSNILCCWGLALLLGSCERNFLDAKPDKSLLVPTTLRDFQALLDNSFNVMNITPYLGEVSSDDFYIAENAILSYQETLQNCYRWDERIYSTSSEQDWDLPYKQILYANVVLEGIENLATNEARVRNLKGMALFYRSWALYQVAQIFSAPYSTKDASKVMGVPVRTRSDVSRVSERGTLQNTYERILFDLTEAISLLDEKQDVPTRPSKAAAYAFMARLQLVLQDYQKAKVYADSTLAMHNHLLNYNTLDSTIINPMPSLFLTSNRHPEILFLSILIPNSYVTDNRNTLVDTTLYALYSNNDLRKVLFFSKDSQFRGSYMGMQAFQFSGLATDEIYLIRSEALARLGDSEAACKDLNTLLDMRWKHGKFQPLSLRNTDELLKLILEERRKELIGRGVRWSDLKRLNQDSRFAKTLYRKIDGKEYSLLPGSVRYVLPIPDDEISGSGIDQNIR